MREVGRVSVSFEGISSLDPWSPSRLVARVEPNLASGGAVSAVSIVQIVIGISGIGPIGALPGASGRPLGAGGSAWELGGASGDL